MHGHRGSHRPHGSRSRRRRARGRGRRGRRADARPAHPRPSHRPRHDPRRARDRHRPRPSQVSSIENGKREPRLSMLRTIALALGTTVDDLLRAGCPVGARGARDRRRARPARARCSQALGLRPFRVAKGDERPDPADDPRAAPRDRPPAPRAGGDPRGGAARERRAARRDARPRQLLSRARGEGRRAARGRRPHRRTGLAPAGRRHGEPPRLLAALRRRPAALDPLGDRQAQRTHLPADAAVAVARLALPHPAGAREPPARSRRSRGNYADFLRQRIETNYLTAAILLPEQAAVRYLTEAKNLRRISMEELRDHFAVSYETAAHRFTNLATARLDIPVHFMKVHESGTIIKAYENDRVRFPVRCARRRRGHHGVPQLDGPHGVRRRGPVQPLVPVHRHHRRARSGAPRASRRRRRASTRCRSACRSST